MTSKRTALLLLFLTSALLGVPFASAEEFTSTDFKILDHPELVPAGYSTSAGFQLIGTIGEVAIGTSTASGFQVCAGSLCFEEVSAAATPTPTPGPSLIGGGNAPRAPFDIFIPTSCSLAGDLDCDGHIDLRDLSMFLYFTPQPTPNPADLNNDARVDLYDFSRLLARWTGRLVPFASDESQRLTGGEEPRAGDSRVNVASVGQARGQSPSGTSSAEEVTQSRFVDTAVSTVASFIWFMSDFIATIISRVGSFIRSLW